MRQLDFVGHLEMNLPLYVATAVAHQAPCGFNGHTRTFQHDVIDTLHDPLVGLWQCVGTDHQRLKAVFSHTLARVNVHAVSDAFCNSSKKRKLKQQLYKLAPRSSSRGFVHGHKLTARLAGNPDKKFKTSSILWMRGIHVRCKIASQRVDYPKIEWEMK